MLVLDPSTISRFRTRLVSVGTWDRLLETVNDRLRAHVMAVTVGTIVDANLTERPYSPKGGGRVAVAKDRKEHRQGQGSR